MAASSPRRPRHELAVAGAGLLAGAAIAWVALMRQPDPSAVGELEGVRAARALGDELRDALQERLRDPRPLPHRGTLTANRAPLPALRELPDCGGEGLLNPAATLLAYLEEGSGHTGYEEQDRLAREAHAAATEPACRARARLVWIQTAAVSLDGEQLRDALEGIDADLPWDVIQDAHSPRLLAELATWQRLDEAELSALRGRILEHAESLLALGQEGDTLALGDAGVELLVAPQTDALFALIESRLPGLTEELLETPAYARRRRAALKRELPEGTGDRWSLVEAQPAPLAVRTGVDPLFVDLGQLRSEVLDATNVPPGFVLDLGQEPRVEGLPVGPTRELIPGLLSLQVRHPDPEAFASDARSRQRIVRFSLLGLAAAVAAVGLVAARAMARERRLAELKSAFVAGVSHDLRTPLASILLMAENLQEGRVRPERAATYHATIRGEAERLRRRVDDVLDFARIERGEPARAAREDVDRKRLGEELEAAARAAADESTAALAVQRDTLMGEARLDPDAARRCVINLVQNALRHADATRILLALDAPTGCALRITVRDDGKGVSARARRRLFTPFARGRAAEHDPKGGTGLGLSIVRALAQTHGGDARMVPGIEGRGLGVEVTFQEESTTS